MRLRLIPQNTNIDFFRHSKIWLGISGLLTIIALGSFLMQGLNYGIDFRGGTTIRAQSTVEVDVSAYRGALDTLNLGDTTISEVFDPNFRANQHVVMIRVGTQENAEAVSAALITNIEETLKTIAPDLEIVSVESVGPKVSGELIYDAIIAVVVSIGAVLLYIWFRFEWQFALGAVFALIHDVLLTIGIFSELQIKFDLAIIAALLTIVGYSLNDTVVVYDRVRENLHKYKQMTLKDLLNLTINETLSRTLMTSVTTLLALITLLALGGDVIRGFVFAMTWGVIVGTYSSIFVATAMLYRLGVKRDWSKQTTDKGNQFANIDA